MKIKVYQCGHSGLFLPGDYVENWGKWYGRGLGPTPVSECLNTSYGSFRPDQVALVQTVVRPEEWMLPVAESYAPVEFEHVTEEELEAPLEQFTTQQYFRQVSEGQYELVDEKKVAMKPGHPDYKLGNRMICRYDDPRRVRIHALIRAKQQKHPEWAALQALIGGHTYGSDERKVWA